jgi:CDP-L-myo-inositol myo-inositolphosphotransferase
VDHSNLSVGNSVIVLGRERRPDTAVILATANGSGMLGELPPPLQRVHGTRLLERAILAFKIAGVRRFIVVVGARAEKFSARLARMRRLRGLAIELVRCPSWAEGSGHGLAVGAAAAAGPFYLAMADHVFDPAIVQRLGDAAAARPGDVHLATDQLDGAFDLDGATKVASENDAVTALGKDLAVYDRVDVGVFACPASLALGARAAVTAGAATVSEVMRSIIRVGRMRSVAIDGLVWQDVDSPAMRREAERRLLMSTRKSSDGPVSRVLNRPLSAALTRVLARAHVTPNQVTTVVFALGMIAALLIASGSWHKFLVAAVLIQVASILDGCDGELARVDLRASRFGAWYDTLTDNVRYAAMVAASAIALYRREGGSGYLIIGAAFVVGAIYLVAIMLVHLRQTGAAGTHLVIVAKVEAAGTRQDRRPLFRALYALRKLVKQDVLAAIAAVALVLNLPEVMLAGGVLAVAGMILAVDLTLAGTAPSRRGMRFVMGVGGAALLGWLVAQAPIEDIAGALRAMGWPVVLAIPVVVGWMFLNSRGLSALLGSRVGWRPLLYNRIVGDGYNAIVPAAGIGGEPVRIALLGSHVPATDAALAVVCDRAINIAAAFLISAAAIVVSVGWLPLPRELEVAAATYAALAVVASIALLAIVRGGVSGRVVALVGKWFGGGSLQAPGVSIGSRAIAIALAWNLLGRAVAGLEVLLYARLLGIPLSALEVVFVTGVLHAVGTATFVVPQGIGVAEAASVYALQVLGYPPELGLAFGLVRRARLLVFSAAAVALHVIGRRASGRVDRVARAEPASPGPLEAVPVPVAVEQSLVAIDPRTRSA